MPSVVAITTRSTSDPRIKEAIEPRVPLPPARRDLALAFLDDLIEQCLAIPKLAIRLAVTPPVEGLRVSRPALPAETFLPQRGAGIGGRRLHIFEDLFASGFTRAVIIRSDLPDLPADRLATAVARLHEGPQTAVIGPSDRGGCYLFGLALAPGAVPDLVSGVRWQTPHECADLYAACGHAGFTVSTLDRWNEVNSPEDFDRLVARLRESPDAAPHTAEALRALGFLR
jgi:glycosyltransferase A (GT-A) superfamily protein (DUF2064 family)